MTPEEWKVVKAQEKADGKQYSGSPEPVDGKCGAKLANSMERFGMIRYDLNPAGDRTPHLGTGRCYLHGGSTPNHLLKAERNKADIELRTIAQQLGEPDPIGPAVVEGELLVRKMKQWSIVLEQKMDELQTISDWDRAGVEHARVAIELLERGWDRLQKALEFYMKYDLEKKRLQLEEEQGRLIGNTIMSVVQDPQLRLTDDQMELVEKNMRVAVAVIAPALTPKWKRELDAIEVRAVGK